MVNYHRSRNDSIISLMNRGLLSPVRIEYMAEAGLLTETVVHELTTRHHALLTDIALRELIYRGQLSYFSVAFLRIENRITNRIFRYFAKYADRIEIYAARYLLGEPRCPVVFLTACARKHPDESVREKALRKLLDRKITEFVK